MKAVILAAGVGLRIRPLTDNTPKSLLKVVDKTILQRMVDNILSLGITQIAIVTGYLEEQIKSFLETTYPNNQFTFITNAIFDKTNTAYSLNLTKNFIGNDGFIKFDADVVFEKAVLENLINNPGETALCIDKNIHLDKEEVKVICDERGKVLKVGKKLDPSLSKGESIGIEKIGANAGKILFEHLDKLLKNPNNYLEYYDDSYTTLVEKGIPFYAVDITGLKWVEIDTLEDMQNAKKLF